MIQRFISKLTPSQRKIFYCAVILTVFALFDRLFWAPTITYLKTLDQKIEQKENSIKKDLRLLSYKDRILLEQEAYKKYFTQEKKTEEEILADFLKTLEILATESKINLAKVAPAQVRQKTGYKEYSATLECSGQLSDVIKFVYAIDATEDLLKTVQLRIASQKGEADEVNAALTVTKIVISPFATNLVISRPRATEKPNFEQEITVRGNPADNHSQSTSINNMEVKFLPGK